MAARTLLVLFLCAGIAVLGLLAGGEHRRAGARRGEDPMAGYYGAGMPRYPGVDEVPAGAGGSEVGAAGVKLSYFTTEDEPGKVGRFYANAWRQRRFFVREDLTHRGGLVSAVDAEHGLFYQVMLSVQGKRTAVFPSATSSPLRAMEAQPAPVTLFPESRAVMTLGSKEGDKQARVHLSLNEGGLEANVAHYSRELRAAGYGLESGREAPKGAPANQRTLVFRKEGSEVTVSLTALEGTQVRVHLMEIDS